MFRMFWNTLKDGLCYLRNESVSVKVFVLKKHEATGFIWSGQAYTSFNLLRTSFFLQKLLSSLNLKQEM